jgi:hypothetical protein
MAPDAALNQAIGPPLGLGPALPKLCPSTRPQVAAEQFMLRIGQTATILSRIDGFGCGREREWGHRRKRAGSIRRTHPCASTSLAMTGSRCARAAGSIDKGEIAVASREELHAARLSGKRLLALWNALPGVEQQAKLGDRNTLSIALWTAIEASPNPAEDLPRELHENCYWCLR